MKKYFIYPNSKIIFSIFDKKNSKNDSSNAFVKFKKTIMQYFTTKCKKMKSLKLIKV